VTSLTLNAPAKVNYLLDVIRRRPDGYHELRMIMQRVNLCDDISLTLTDLPVISVTCDAGGVPDGPGNIAWKAAKVMLELSGRGCGVSIRITKRIPVAAGLGGGSSDAATVLMGMNDLLGLGLECQGLMELGLKLGADVPFFIFKETALAEGVGEKLTPMPAMPQAWILLVNPGVHVSTAWVYRSLELTKERILASIPMTFRTVNDIAAIFSNDLETVTIPAFPVIDEIKKRMMKLGAAASMMSGSGPTVFGLFADKGSAENACEQFSENTEWIAVVAETL